MLFKFVEYLVEQAIKEFAKQANVILEEVVQPLREIVVEVQITGVDGKDVWTGNGADRFVDEMSKEVLPWMNNIMGLITSFSNAIGKGAEQMKEGEAEANKKAMLLFGLFTGIF